MAMCLLERHRHGKTGREISCYSKDYNKVRNEGMTDGEIEKEKVLGFKTELSLFCCALTDNWTLRPAVLESPPTLLPCLTSGTNLEKRTTTDIHV